MRDTNEQQCPTPADEFTEYAARCLTEHDTQNLAGGKAGEDRLAALVWDHIPEPGHSQRDDRGTSHASQEPQ